MSALVLLEYLGYMLSNLYKKHDQQIEPSHRRKGESWRLQLLCFLINSVKEAMLLAYSTIDLRRACHDNVVGSEADAKVQGCPQAPMT